MIHVLVFAALATSAPALPPAGIGFAHVVHAQAPASLGLDAAVAAEPGESFESVAFSWSGPADAAFDLQVRGGDDRGGWSDWMAAGLDDDVTDRSEGKYFSTIVHFGHPVPGAEYRLVPAKAGQVARDIHATMFAPPPSERRERPARHSDGFTVGPLHVRSRTDWACPDGAGARWTPAYSTVTHLIVHHTDGANSLPDWPAEVRNIWYYHTVTRGWGDIGYNYLIDPTGQVYEGRAGGDGAIGAHFSCRNTNTAGIAMMGTFITGVPSEAARESLDTLLRELSRKNGIKATALVLHQPSGLVMPVISSHRDGNPSPLVCTKTDCPGDALYALLPAIRASVASCTPPSITRQLASIVITDDAAATLSVEAAGTAPLQFQWYTGNAGNTSSPIKGATDPTLSASAGATLYWVRVSNECGSADSVSAVVAQGPLDRRRPSR